jgi:hypothetical protein
LNNSPCSHRNLGKYGQSYFITFSQKLNSVDFSRCMTNAIRTNGLITIFVFVLGALDDTDKLALSNYCPVVAIAFFVTVSIEPSRLHSTARSLRTFQLV